jgi:hypothetical protein
MRGVLSENSKQEYAKSVTEFLLLEEKNIFARRMLLYKQADVTVAQ